MPSSLVIAFRQKFPEGSILSEVLTIYDGLFVVRVSVATGGNLLSQALAANNSIELAEDIACNRALERLSLSASEISPAASRPTGTPQSKGNSSIETPAAPSQSDRVALQVSLASSSLPEECDPSEPQVASVNGMESEKTAASATSLEVVPPLPMNQTLSASEPQASTSGPQAETLFPRDEHLEADAVDSSSPEFPQPALKLATPPKPKAPVPEETASLAEASPQPADNLADFSRISTDPIDLSDIIAQTDVELQRLGWGVNQGREFLEKTYGKRSRHDLTDEELLEFLLYLESQSLPSA